MTVATISIASRVTSNLIRSSLPRRRLRIYARLVWGPIDLLRVDLLRIALFLNDQRPNGRLRTGDRSGSALPWRLPVILPKFRRARLCLTGKWAAAWPCGEAWKRAALL